MTDHVNDDWGDDGGLGPLLDAYAGDRLRADPERTRRVRAQVAALARAAVEAERMRSARFRVDTPRPIPATSRGGFVFRLLRIPAAAAAAWILVGALAVGGVVAGSGPGGPFYGPRLWVEELTLPSDPVARSEAQLARLDARLAEAEQAAVAGNGAAVTAALDAYRTIADGALQAAGTDLTRREHLSLELGRHVAVLQALVDEVPGRASEAIRNAVDRAETRIEQILAIPPGTPGKPEGTPGKPEATARPTPPGKPEATAKPTPRGRPEATPQPKPEATPRPTPRGKAEATPKPTPRGKAEATPKPTPRGKAEATPKPTPRPHPTPAGKPTPTPTP